MGGPGVRPNPATRVLKGRIPGREEIPLDSIRFNDYYSHIMARSLLTEIKQTRPFEAPEVEAHLNLTRTADDAYIPW